MADSNMLKNNSNNDNSAIHIFDYLPENADSIISLLTERFNYNLPRYRVNQLMDWVYHKGVVDPQHMTNLSKADRQEISEVIKFLASTEITYQISKVDGTQKLLLQWDQPKTKLTTQTKNTRDNEQPQIDKPSNNNKTTECVVIPSSGKNAERFTACISSQVGCPVSCTFCASGIGDYFSNLTAGQIVEQVWLLNQKLAANGKHITNVVFMGMGEPLANYKAVVKAVRIINSEKCLNIGQRKITVSTVGIPTAIKRLAEEQLQITLALSLHAPNDELRRQLIPWAQHFSLNDILQACRYYFQCTGREVTLEYLLLRGVNDNKQQARELAKLAHSLRSNVNLIQYNEVPELDYQRPIDTEVIQFKKILLAEGVNTHVRASKGRDITAACGQLRRDASIIQIPQMPQIT